MSTFHTGNGKPTKIQCSLFEDRHLGYGYIITTHISVEISYLACAIMILNVTMLFSLLISLSVSHFFRMILPYYWDIIFHSYPFKTMDLCFLKLGIFGSAIAHLPGMFLPLNLLIEYWFEHVTMGFHVKFIFSTMIFCRGVPGFVTDSPCGVCCHGTTTCLLYVSLLFGRF